MRYLKGVPEDFLRETFAYDPTSPSGLVHLRIKHFHRKHAGLRRKCAGTLTFLGYWKVAVNYNGKAFGLRAHRVVYLLCTGVDIEGMQVDHIDNNRSNNIFENLRACTKSQNDWNRKLTRPTNTGIKGLCENTKNRSFLARVSSQRKSHHKVFSYGRKATDAQKAEAKANAIAWLRKTRERLHGGFANHGDEGTGDA